MDCFAIDNTWFMPHTSLPTYWWYGIYPQLHTSTRHFFIVILTGLTAPGHLTRIYLNRSWFYTKTVAWWPDCLKTKFCKRTSDTWQLFFYTTFEMRDVVYCNWVFRELDFIGLSSHQVQDFAGSFLHKYRIKRYVDWIFLSSPENISMKNNKIVYESFHFWFH